VLFRVLAQFWRSCNRGEPLSAGQFRQIREKKSWRKNNLFPAYRKKQYLCTDIQARMNQPLTYTVTPLSNLFADNYTFSAKERDPETGLSYFGSRYYSSDLSVWLSVDPMAAKYPSLSPYVYCADNPVRLVDPDGEEIGDFYDQWGRKIGSDGHADDIVFIVSDQNSQNQIKENRRNHGYTNADDVKVDVATTYDVLREAADVYERTVRNGGYNEEASALPTNGSPNDWAKQSGVNEHSVEVPLPQGDVFIHSHTLRKRNPQNPCDYATPKVISKKDITHFNDFKLNIVVGDDGGDCIGGVLQGRIATVSFYDSNSKNLLNLPLTVVKKIVDNK